MTHSASTEDNFRGLSFTKVEGDALAEMRSGSSDWRKFLVWDLENRRLAQLNIANTSNEEASGAASTIPGLEFGVLRSHRIFESILDRGSDDGVPFFVSNILTKSESLSRFLEREMPIAKKQALELLSNYLRGLIESGGIESAPSCLRFFDRTKLRIIETEKLCFLQFSGFESADPPSSASDENSMWGDLKSLVQNLGIDDLLKIEVPESSLAEASARVKSLLTAEFSDDEKDVEKLNIHSEFQDWLSEHPHRRTVLREGAPAGLGMQIPDAEIVEFKSASETSPKEAAQSPNVPAPAIADENEAALSREKITENPEKRPFRKTMIGGGIVAVLLWVVALNIEKIAGFVDEIRAKKKPPVITRNSLETPETPSPASEPKVENREVAIKTDSLPEKDETGTDFEATDQLSDNGEFTLAIEKALQLPTMQPEQKEAVHRKIGEVTERWRANRDPAAPLSSGESDLLESLYPRVPEVAHLLAADAIARLAKGEKFIPAPSTIPAEVDWVLESALLENPIARREIAKRIFHTPAQKGDFQRAVEWFEAAAKGGDPEACFYFGECLVLGKGVQQDRKKGAKFLETAAEAGDMRAADLLGVCLVRGWGAEVDYPRAVELFQSAVSYGHIPSHYNLGARYAEGQGVEKDPERAASIFQAGATGGNPICMLVFARCHESGFGVPIDPEKSREWYQKAASSGNHEAQEWCADKGIKYQPKIGADASDPEISTIKPLHDLKKEY